MENNQEKQDIGFLKAVAAVLIIAAFVSYCVMYYKVFYLGNYYMHATIFVSVVFGISPILLGYGGFRLLQMLFKKKN